MYSKISVALFTKIRKYSTNFFIYDHCTTIPVIFTNVILRQILIVQIFVKRAVCDLYFLIFFPVFHCTVF